MERHRGMLTLHTANAMHPVVMAQRMVLHNGMEFHRAMCNETVANTAMDHCMEHHGVGLCMAVHRGEVRYCMVHRGVARCCTVSRGKVQHCMEHRGEDQCIEVHRGLGQCNVHRGAGQCIVEDHVVWRHMVTSPEVAQGIAMHPFLNRRLKSKKH